MSMVTTLGDLFDRDVILNAGGLQIASRLIKRSDPSEVVPILRVKFNVTQSLKKDPNTAEISIFNLSEDSRSQLQEKGIPTILEAGYFNPLSAVKGTTEIFNGNLEIGQNIRDGVNWITTIQSEDGGTPFKRARINKSIKGPVSLTQVLKEAAQPLLDLGINVGNLTTKANKGSVRGILKQFNNGTVLSGKAEQIMHKVAKTMGYTMSIQNGAFLLIEPEETIGETVPVIRQGTGMIGNPESGEKGIIKVRSLIQPDLFPGYRMKLETLAGRLDGFYRIQKSVFIGDTGGSEWYVDLEAKPVV